VDSECRDGLGLVLDDDEAQARQVQVLCAGVARRSDGGESKRRRGLDAKRARYSLQAPIGFPRLLVFVFHSHFGFEVSFLSSPVPLPPTLIILPLESHPSLSRPSLPR
jgi:hypothetical protein